MEAIMNIKDHHTIQELQTLYRKEKDARLARRMHGVYLKARGLSCPPAVCSIPLQRYQARSQMTTTNGSVHIVISE